MFSFRQLRAAGCLPCQGTGTWQGRKLLERQVVGVLLRWEGLLGAGLPTLGTAGGGSVGWGGLLTTTLALMTVHRAQTAAHGIVHGIAQVGVVLGVLQVGASPLGML